MSAVIDASALLATLLDEDGAEAVIPVMRGSAMSAVNASECFSRAVDRGAAAKAVAAMLRDFEIEIVPFGLEDAAAAADLRPKTKHVGASLGDRACLALAMKLGQALYTGDRRLAELDLDIDIRLIR
jgi:PIN domain nuclease of toxin-antitoxin system